MAFGTSLELKVQTQGGSDPQGYTAVSRDTSIVVVQESPVIPSAEGGTPTATFMLETGQTSLGQVTGATKIDINGINTGARAELSVEVVQV